MTFVPDIGDDALLIDGTETVTLHGLVTVEVAGAKRGQVTTHEAQMAALALAPDDLAWVLPEVNLAGVEPRPGDAIEDAAAVRWTIVNVSRSPLTRLWRAISRRQR